MPSTTSKENAGRLRNFKNKGRDQDVSALFFYFNVGLLSFICFVILLSFAGDEAAEKRCNSGAAKGKPFLRVDTRTLLARFFLAYIACG